MQDNAIYQTPLGQQAVQLAKDVTYLMMSKGLQSGRTEKEEVAVAIMTAQLLLDTFKKVSTELGIDTTILTTGDK